MVSIGDNMFGSQFFVTLDDDLDYLVRSSLKYFFVWLPAGLPDFSWCNLTKRGNI
jgi:hypothetical protein